MNAGGRYARLPADGVRRSGDAGDGRGAARARPALRAAKLLVGSYLAVSVLTLVAAAVLRDDPAAVNDAVWIRGTIVALSATLMLAFVLRAARGSRGAYRRLRVVAAVMIVAIALIVALPGPFPLWMKVEQSFCGLLLVGVFASTNTRALRGFFARR